MTAAPDVVLLVAGPGFGKSTALAGARPRDGVVCSARDAMDGLDARDWTGIDDVHELSSQEQRRLLAEVSALPPTARVVLTSRRPLAPAARRLLRGRVRERGPEDLALDPYTVRRVLVDEYGVADPEVPVNVHALTAGWPALVHFAADALARRPEADIRMAMTSPDAPAVAWLRDVVLSTITPAARRLLACVTGLGPISPDVCRVVAEELGLDAAEWSIADLAATGVLTPLRGFGRDGLLEAVPPVAAVVAVEQPATEACLRVVARGLEEAGLPYGAALAALRAGDRAGAMRLVANQGETMLRRGDAAGVVELVRSTPADERSDAVQLAYADALRIRGDIAEAARAFRPLVVRADSSPEPGWPIALASRVAAVHYASGRLDEALQTLGRADAAAEPTADVEAVEWMAAKVHILCSLGCDDQAAALADATLERAEMSGSERMHAAAHLAMARVSQGERKAAHHEFALQAAIASADVITAARILVNTPERCCPHVDLDRPRPLTLDLHRGLLSLDPPMSCAV